MTNSHVIRVLSILLALWALTSGVLVEGKGRRGRGAPRAQRGRGRRRPSVTGNPVDDCWAGSATWHRNRQNLAKCAPGYGKDAEGGAVGKIYRVTDPGDDPVNPQPGTLRYGVTRDEPLWIVFARDMSYTLEAEMVVNSFKTIDARGAKVQFHNSPCLFLSNVSNVIIHGIHFSRCSRRGGRQEIRISEGETRTFGESTGDAITAVHSHSVWIDHCSFDSIQVTHTDKHIVIKQSSAYFTISNCKFENQDKVILLGHTDRWRDDRKMRVTVMLNYFGRNLVQRMPRCRFGNFHVVNNYYPYGWEMYAIGGSAEPTILSEANYFVARDDQPEVTKRNVDNIAETRSWNWKSRGDIFKNRATFDESGSTYLDVPYSYTPLPASSVPKATARAGPLGCREGRRCV